MTHWRVLLALEDANKKQPKMIKEKQDAAKQKKGIINTKNNKTTKLDWLIENWLALDDLKDEVDMDNDVEQGHCRATGSPLLRGFCRTPGIS